MKNMKRQEKKNINSVIMNNYMWTQKRKHGDVSLRKAAKVNVWEGKGEEEQQVICNGS